MMLFYHLNLFTQDLLIIRSTYYGQAGGGRRTGENDIFIYIYICQSWLLSFAFVCNPQAAHSMRVIIVLLANACDVAYLQSNNSLKKIAAS